ncbi:odorant receptor 82a-like isoform X2 [Anoplolepis gracilipes]|uniref:odorant receptor 82a-like isoform X2 n=1 Tax=Anoplolepis gracilipes TaxID=354296 RepID=UPI003BA1F697
MTYSKRVSTRAQLTYKNNNDYSVQLVRWFLMPIGVWPRMSMATKIKRLSSYMHILVSLFFVVIVAVPFLLYVLVEEEDIEIKLSMIGPLSHWIMGIINYCLLLIHNNDIRECVQHMETDWKLIKRNEDQQVMLRQVKVGRFVVGMCAIFMQSGTFLFAIVKTLTTTIIIVGNETISMRLMACPIYTKFIDTRFSPANEIMQVVEMISCYIVNSIIAGVCSLDAIFAVHAYAQLTVLFSWLNKLVDKNDGNISAERRLGAIVEHHLRVLSFISRVESIMQTICLVELLGCTMNMCLLAYYFITNWDTLDMAKLMSFVLIYLSVAFNIFVFCYIGEILTEQCKTVGQKAYMIDWYELPHETALGLILIIARSNNVTKLTAGKFFQLSIATFGDCKNVGEEAYMTNWYDLPHKTALGLVLIIAQSSNVIKITAGKLFQLSIATFGDVIKTSVVYLNILRTMTPPT